MNAEHDITQHVKVRSVYRSIHSRLLQYIASGTTLFCLLCCYSSNYCFVLLRIFQPDAIGYRLSTLQQSVMFELLRCCIINYTALYQTCTRPIDLNTTKQNQ